jgi:hypothetical protein
MKTTTTTPVVSKQLLLIELDTGWEDLILGGAKFANFLGLAMVSASQRNLALTPRAGYSVQFIQNINSLHATLLQVASAMQTACQGAHEDLVRTQVSMDQIPDHIKASLLLIKTAPDDLRKKLLPVTLRNVDRAANEGSAVSKSTLARFVHVGKLIDEFVAVLSYTVSGIVSNLENYHYLSEVEVHVTDIQVQWYLLVQLLIKFSERADIIRENIAKNFVNSTQQAENGNGLHIEAERITHLKILIPATIAIDQSTQLLQMMAHTYSDISNEYMATQAGQSGSFLSLQTSSMRATSQRELWQRIVAQSVEAARLAQKRENEFMEASHERQKEYNDFLLDAVVAT